LGYSFEDDHLGRRGPIVGLEDSGAAGSTSIRVVGQARRRRRLVEREDVVVECAARQFTGQPCPSLQLLRAWWLVPIDGDCCVAHHEDVGVIGPFVSRVVEPVEVRPPEWLVRAAGGGPWGALPGARRSPGRAGAG